MIAEGSDIEVRLAVCQYVAAAGLVKDIGAEVYEILGLRVSEELGESANPGDLGWGLLR
jgi:hypothetical protein